MAGARRASAPALSESAHVVERLAQKYSVCDVGKGGHGRVRWVL